MGNQFHIPRGLPIQPPKSPKPTPQKHKVKGPSFDQVLSDQIKQDKQIKFSAHAEKRLASNNIELSHTQREKLATAMEKAEAKGSRDSLILMDDLAFVVSVQNRTVITVVDGERMRDNVFTQIDSTVITNNS